jgi:hypothetical protein
MNGTLLRRALLVGLFLALVRTTAAGAQSNTTPPPPGNVPPGTHTFTRHATIPIDLTVFNPSANEGVYLTGQFNAVAHVQVDARNVTRIAVHLNPQSVSGLGLTSGAEYRFGGVYRAVFFFGSQPSGQLAFVANFASDRLTLGTRWIFAWEFASGASGGRVGFFLDDVKVTAK